MRGLPRASGPACRVYLGLGLVQRTSKVPRADAAQLFRIPAISDTRLRRPGYQMAASFLLLLEQMTTTLSSLKQHKFMTL